MNSLPVFLAGGLAAGAALGLGWWWLRGARDEQYHDLAGDGQMPLLEFARRWRLDPGLQADAERLKARLAAARREGQSPPKRTQGFTAELVVVHHPRSRQDLLAALSDLRAEAQAAGEVELAMELHKTLMFRLGPAPAVVVRRPGDLERTN